MFSIVFVVVVFVFAPGLDEKKVYCTYSFTLVNKKKSFVRSSLHTVWTDGVPQYFRRSVSAGLFLSEIK